MARDPHQQPAEPEPQAAAPDPRQSPQRGIAAAIRHARRSLSPARVMLMLPGAVVAVVAVAAMVIIIHHELGVRPATQASGQHAGSGPAAGTTDAARSAPAAGPSQDPAVAAAAKARDDAARWIAAQVTAGTVVACDPLMCDQLLRDDFPAADIDQLGTGATDPLGAGVVVSTAAVRSQYGSRLTGVYAPAVLASFGTGQDMVAVLATAPGGSAAYQSAAGADLQARQDAGGQLVHNPNVRASVTAQSQLLSGQVDSRLLVTLAALSHTLPVRITSFGGAAPGAGPDQPLRAMTLSAAVRLPRGRSYTAAVLAFLQAQQAPFPDSATVSGTGSAAVLQISVTAPSPLGLLTAQPPR